LNDEHKKTPATLPEFFYVFYVIKVTIHTLPGEWFFCHIQAP
jgi:hypothetical protein